MSSFTSSAGVLAGSIIGAVMTAALNGASRGAAKGGAARFFIEPGRMDRVKRRRAGFEPVPGHLPPVSSGSSASLRSQRRGPAADVSDCRPHQSEPQAVGEGAHEEGQ